MDALGSTTQYENYLSSLFPGINFTVCPKADSLFKIVGAASVAAKVTRDAWMEDWTFHEVGDSALETAHFQETDWTKTETGSGYPSGKRSHKDQRR